uniref:Homoserine dehydrogenase n=1 Tax=Cannabis sativa TaxID=3483 RepID=A0A803PY99_CANSA
MKNIPVVLMGCGGVGRQLLQHIVTCRSLHANQGIRLRVVGVCDSKSLVVAPDVFSMELSDNLLLEVCRVKLDSSSSLLTLNGSGECQVYSNPELTKKIIDIAALLGKSTGLALVDCSASSETIGVLNRVVDIGCCAVLANKKPLTCKMEDYDKLVSHPRFIRHESTVGAGLPVIATINRLLSSGDPVHRIIGSLSGTLGYVMSEVEDGKPFSQVVKSAKSLGYTEPDPRDDLSGMDVARKALILARLLGQRLNLDSIKIESLYPGEMGPGVMSVEEFLGGGVSLLDKDFQERVHKASSKGNVLRYVCVIEGSRCEVGIQELPKDSALGRLKGSDNVLEVYSRCYPEQPLVIQGAGAGNDTTATGVLADILDLQDLFP